MLSSKTIRTFNSVKHEPQRPAWKSKKISPSQVAALAHDVELVDLIMLDCGTASLLLDCLFKLKDAEYDITDSSMLAELNIILYD